jgi:hypothetical protein
MLIYQHAFFVSIYFPVETQYLVSSINLYMIGDAKYCASTLKILKS